MGAGIARASQLLGVEEATAVPFILRYLEEVRLEGATLHTGDGVEASGEKRWTHIKESTGILTSDDDSVTD